MTNCCEQLKNKVEALYEHKPWTQSTENAARKILADLAGTNVDASLVTMTKRIMFNSDEVPAFVYVSSTAD